MTLSAQSLTKSDLVAYAWKYGQLDYLLKDYQLKIEQAFLNSHERIFVLEIGRQVGKTFWNCKKAIEVCLAMPNARVKYASAFATSVQEYVIPTLRYLINFAPEAARPQIVISKNKVVFPNGSEIKLLGLDRDPNAGRGPYCDLYIIDEAGYVRTLSTIIDNVILPMFNTRPHAKLILSSSSPSTTSSYFYALADKYKLRGSYVRMTIDDTDLSQERIAQIRSEYDDESAMMRELYCARILDATLAIVPEWKPNYVRSPDSIPKYRPLYHGYVSMDLGVLHDYTAAIFGFYDFLQAKLFITHEFGIKGPDTTTDKIANLLKTHEQKLAQPIHMRIADNNNPLLLNDLLIKHDLHFVPASKTELRAMVNQMRMWVQSGRVVIDPSCRMTIGSIESGIWTANRKEFDRSLVYGHYDWLAALMYLIRHVDEHINPIPIGYGLDASSPNVIIPRQEVELVPTLKPTGFD